jgi:hypothetical protein
MGRIFTKPPKDKKQSFYLYTNNPGIITIINPLVNGYRIVSSENNETIIILYQNIKKLTYEGIYNKKYKKYSVIYKKINGDFTMYSIKIPIDIIDSKCEKNKNAKLIKNILVERYKIYLIENKMDVDDYIFI